MKRILFISAIFICFALRVSAMEVTITVPVAGSLPYVLKQQCDWENVTSLTVYGEINDDDCEFLRIMARGKKGSSEETLEYYDGSEKGSLQILDLGNATFKGKTCSFPATELTKLTFPLIKERTGVTYIDSETLKYCNNLEEVDMSKYLSIRSISEKAFYKKDGNLKNLKKIVLPPNVKYINHDAFYGDFHVSKLPSSLSIIEYDAFKLCTIDEAELGPISDISSCFKSCTLPEKMKLHLFTVRGWLGIINQCYGLKDLTLVYDYKGTYNIDRGATLADNAYDLETLSVNISRESELYANPSHYLKVS